MSRRPWLDLAVCLLPILAAGPGEALAQFNPARSRAWLDAPGSGLAGTAHNGDNFGLQVVTGDFDADGYDDLAAFDRESAAVLNPGAVRVQHGGPSGLATVSEIYYDIWPSTMTPDAEPGDEFGSVLAVGDFNGDGYDDLAIGIPGEDAVLTPPPIAIETTNCGAVLVLWGSAGGIGGAGTLGVKLLPSFAGNLTAAQFGRALAAGDFDGDGRDDLAVGAPTAEVSGQDQAGFVAVYRGGSGGFSPSPRYLHQDASDASGAVTDVAEPLDRFGWALAAGNFNGDTNGPGGRPIMDLAVGAPGEGDAAAATVGSGLVHLFYGSTSGTPLAFNTDQTVDQTDVTAGESIETGDGFGFTLAAGDVTGDGKDDLVIAAPYESVIVDGGSFESAGRISVLHGDFPFVVANGTGSSLGVSELNLGMPGVNDFFGLALALTDFTGDGRADIVAGAPFRDLPDPNPPHPLRLDSGAVFLIQGWPVAFGAGHGYPRLLAQERDGHPGDLGFGELYGYSLAVGDFDGDRHPDLLVGAPSEDLVLPGTSVSDSGAVFELRGTLFSDGFEVAGLLYWSRHHPRPTAPVELAR